MSNLTRRLVITLLAAGGLVPAAYLARRKLRQPGNANGPPSVNSPFADKLVQALNAELGPACEGQFSVPTVDLAHSDGLTTAKVVVRLDWPPGMRQRLVTAAGPNEEDVRLAVIDSCKAIFGSLSKVA